jgi:hypothetical protein
MQAATIGMFDEVDRQLVGLARAAMSAPAASTPAPAPAALPIVVSPSAIPVPGVIWLPPPPVNRHRRRVVTLAAGVLGASLGLAVIAAAILYWPGSGERLTGTAAVDALVTRIVAAESNGNGEAKNRLSSAAGPAQFLDGTWLELMRAYRPALVKGRTRDEVLDLRRRPPLAREIARRFAERNAALLERRGLPVTAGALYLAHFAGPAGAAALLAAPPGADAASVMAKADASGRTKRAQIVKANPFLDTFTAADVRRWAERKMDGPALALGGLLPASTQK